MIINRISLQYHPDNHYGVYSRWSEFRDEINDSLMRNLRDPIQAIKYLQDIILSTKEIAQYYYPKVTDENHLEAAALLHFLSSIEVPSYKPIIRIWKEAKAYAYERYQKEDITFEQYLDILKRAATDKAKEEGKLHGYNEFTILNAMLSNMYMLAVHIAGCLLKNYSSTTVEDLQSLCGVKISNTVDEWDLILHLQFSQEEIDHCREKMAQIAKRRADSNKVKTGESNPVPEDETLMPNEMDKIIRKCISIYEINDGSIVFKDKKIKHYAIFLKELYRVVYKVREEHFSMQWKKVPIYPMSDGTIPTPEKLSNGIRNYDANKDVAIMEKYRAALNSALASIGQS